MTLQICKDKRRITETLAAAPDQVEAYFYRCSGGAEIDLLLT